jgi:hypothetical protein
VIGARARAPSRRVPVAAIIVSGADRSERRKEPAPGPGPAKHEPGSRNADPEAFFFVVLVVDDGGPARAARTLLFFRRLVGLRSGLLSLLVLVLVLVVFCRRRDVVNAMLSRQVLVGQDLRGREEEGA